LQKKQVRPFIIDANVLIDYCKSDLGILELLSTKISPIYISRSTLENVNELMESEVAKHHLIVKTPDLQTLILATQVRGQLAVDDRETLLLAKKYGWICITNDKPLRKECEKESVSVLWGLEPLKILVENSLIKPEKAITVAKNIRKVNPRYITAEIVKRFEEQIIEIERKLHS